MYLLNLSGINVIHNIFLAVQPSVTKLSCLIIPP